MLSWRVSSLALCSVFLLLSSSRKYPYLPHGRVPSNPSVTPLEIPIVISLKHFFKFLGLTEPFATKKFQSLLWGKYRYFLELHTIKKSLTEKEKRSTVDWQNPTCPFFFSSLFFSQTRLAQWHWVRGVRQQYPCRTQLLEETCTPIRNWRTKHYCYWWQRERIVWKSIQDALALETSEWK